MSLFVSVLLVWSGIISYFIFYFAILFSSKWQSNRLIESLLDGSISSALLISITAIAWFQRRNRYGHLAFAILLLITSFWFYFFVNKISYPSIKLKIKEEGLFPSEILDQISQEHKAPNSEEGLAKLIFILPSLSDMFVLHAIKRVLELKRQEHSTFSWHLMIVEEPSETPLFETLQEYASITIIQEDYLIQLIDEENDSLLKIGKPFLFILSADSKIQWILNPKSRFNLLMFDEKMDSSIKSQLLESFNQ